ncbi:hypothetical protein lbkm_2202 [Lachnospiraceae bacterium KM106-2]|nr:hypothetical protein lbkm_2202 [Lachnospiraceae bacterium KM106-2]
MGRFGFSYIGLLFLILLFLPNIFWTKRKPDGYEATKENKILLAMERVGQVSVTTLVLICGNLNLRKWSWWSLWLVAAIVWILLYEYWWIRYFRSERKLSDFYSSLFMIPVGGATLPILAFLCLSMYGRLIVLLTATIILGIGHIGIHLQHAKEINVL